MYKNITLSADEILIKKARQRAQKEKRSLNAIFREWLQRYTATPSKGRDYSDLMKSLSYAKVGKKFSRDELNER